MTARDLDFDVWLAGQLKNPRLRKAFEAEDLRAKLTLRISELRRLRRLSQAQLAKRLKTTQQMVSDIETFKHPNLTLTTLQRMAAALDCRLVVEFREVR